jgi:hypothetical protein
MAFQSALLYNLITPATGWTSTSPSQTKEYSNSQTLAIDSSSFYGMIAAARAGEPKANRFFEKLQLISPKTGDLGC